MPPFTSHQQRRARGSTDSFHSPSFTSQGMAAGLMGRAREQHGVQHTWATRACEPVGEERSSLSHVDASHPHVAHTHTPRAEKKCEARQRSEGSSSCCEAGRGLWSDRGVCRAPPSAARAGLPLSPSLQQDSSCAQQASRWRWLCVCVGVVTSVEAVITIGTWLLSFFSPVFSLSHTHTFCPSLILHSAPHPLEPPPLAHRLLDYTHAPLDGHAARRRHCVCI